MTETANMIKRVTLLIFFCFLTLQFSFAQDFSLVYIKKISDLNEVPAVYESINKPLLIYDNSIYAIGSDCIAYSLIDGSYGERRKNGKTNKRGKNGQTDQRMASGESDDRLAGGEIGNRNKRGKETNRKKDGRSDTRNKNGDSEDRNAGGMLSDVPRCEVADNGKLVLFTRLEMQSHTAQIYYKHKFFNDKYFKIHKL